MHAWLTAWECVFLPNSRAYTARQEDRGTRLNIGRPKECTVESAHEIMKGIYLVAN